MQWTNKQRETLSRGLTAVGPDLVRMPGYTAFYIGHVLRNESHWIAGGGAVTLHERGLRFQIDARLGGSDICIAWAGVVGVLRDWDLLFFEVRTLRGQSATLVLRVGQTRMHELELAGEILARLMPDRFQLGQLPLERVTAWLPTP